MTFRQLLHTTGAAVFALAVLVPVHARAGTVPVIDTTNWIQNYAQYVEAYQQTTGQLEIIQHMTTNLMTHGSPQWGEVATLINRLQGRDEVVVLLRRGRRDQIELTLVQAEPLVEVVRVGASGREDLALAREFVSKYGKTWPAEWLRRRALSDWADY